MALAPDPVGAVSGEGGAVLRSDSPSPDTRTGERRWVIRLRAWGRGPRSAPRSRGGNYARGPGISKGSVPARPDAWPTLRPGWGGGHSLTPSPARHPGDAQRQQRGGMYDAPWEEQPPGSPSPSPPP